MANNPPIGDNARRGAVHNRSQVYSGPGLPVFDVPLHLWFQLNEPTAKA